MVKERKAAFYELEKQHMMRIRSASASRNEAIIRFTLDGQAFEAYEGDTIASALYASGKRSWRRSRSGEERGLLCGIGHCFDCLVTVDGMPDVRACQTQVRQGMVVITNLNPK
jgi:predicted molibdopterin-dependent oxidoreductase YjgC